ncbi:hypothetical protein AVEN_116658-1, partial [Araneus ventricosus]
MDEVTKIWQLKAEGKLVQEISAIINRSKKYIYRVLSSGCIYKSKRRSGRPHVTNKRDDRQIQRLEVCCKVSASSLSWQANIKKRKLTLAAKKCACYL